MLAHLLPPNAKRLACTAQHWIICHWRYPLTIDVHYSKHVYLLADGEWFEQTHAVKLYINLCTLIKQVLGASLYGKNYLNMMRYAQCRSVGTATENELNDVINDNVASCPRVAPRWHHASWLVVKMVLYFPSQSPGVSHARCHVASPCRSVPILHAAEPEELLRRLITGQHSTARCKLWQSAQLQLTPFSALS